jgi:cell division protein ZapA (FtsZ GTPase activity inhibitor)
LESTKSVTRSNIGMLAALNIADEYHRLKDTHEAVVSRLNQLSKKLSMTLTEEG